MATIVTRNAVGECPMAKAVRRRRIRPMRAMSQTGCRLRIGSTRKCRKTISNR